MKVFLSSTLFTGLIAATAPSATAAPIFYGPTPYLQMSDSPFSALTLSYFYLETFEDGLLNTSGVTSPPAAASPGLAASPTRSTPMMA